MRIFQKLLKIEPQQMANKINGEHYPHLDYPVHNVFFCFICHDFLSGPECTY